jgi:cation diffusion facilitator CzcD-associated flavoprotein CzcO
MIEQMFLRSQCHFSDIPFAYGPFVPHHVPRQYIESYITHHKVDTYLELQTTVEDLLHIPSSPTDHESWKLTLRKHDPVRTVDIWWNEMFDAVILANGHYSIPFVSDSLE